VLEPCNVKVLRTVLRGLGASNRAWLLGGCVALMGQDYLTGNGADFAMVFKLENICGTDVGSKANDGGASRWCSFPHDGGFLHRRASWPQISIEKVLFDVE
jgi:hypothetical protein